MITKYWILGIFGGLLLGFIVLVSLVNSSRREHLIPLSHIQNAKFHQLSDGRSISLINPSMGDSLCLYRIVDMDADEQRGILFMLDSLERHVLLYEAEKGIVRGVLGRMGQGPSEFMEPICMSVDPDIKTLCVFDRNLRKFKFFRYDNLEYVGQIPWHKSPDLSGFLYHNGELSICVPSDSSIIEVWSDAGDSLRTFGVPITTRNRPYRRLWYDGMLVLLKGDQLSLVYRTRQSVSTYSKKGELLSEFPYHAITDLKSRYSEPKPVSNNSVSFWYYITDVVPGIKYDSILIPIRDELSDFDFTLLEYDPNNGQVISVVYAPSGIGMPIDAEKSMRYGPRMARIGSDIYVVFWSEQVLRRYRLIL
jgi:hypothetical protein